MILKNKIHHYINGQDFGKPRNWDSLVIKKDFINKKENVDINITDLEFVLEANKYLQKRILDGLSGGVGIFEGEPYQIKIGNQNDPIYTFDGYLDFTEETTIIGGEEISVSLKKRQGTDWLNDVADSFSFAYLADEGIITSNDYIKVPYVINYVPDGMQLIVLSMSLFMMTKELIENIEKVAETIADVSDAAAPVIGVGVGFGAVAVTAWDTGNFILIVLKTAARIAYVIAVTIAIKSLIEEIFKQLFPAKRYHLGMTSRKMFEKGCEHLGLKFESSIPELAWVHIPEKDKKGGSSGETGHPTNNSSIYTFGDLIREYKKLFNADFRISNGVFYFERKDNFKRKSSFVIPSFFNDQERLLNNIKFNTDEMVSNYNINWSYDTQDQNTLDDQSGRIFQAVTTPIIKTDESLVLIKNLAEIAIPFSLGKTKTSLTTVEEVAKTLGRFVDNLTGIFGGGTNFASKITNRIGSLSLSSDFLTIGKMVKMSGAKLDTDQRKYLSAEILWEQYHKINSFAEIDGNHNQYWIFSGIEVPMTLDQFEEVLENNFVEDSEGNECEIDILEFQVGRGVALIDYRVKKKYTNNLKISYV